MPIQKFRVIRRCCPRSAKAGADRYPSVSSWDQKEKAGSELWNATATITVRAGVLSASTAGSHLEPSQVKSLHAEIGIDAPADVVWSVVSDLAGWARWNPVMKASGTLSEGETLQVTIAAPGGQAMTIDPVVASVDGGREFRWRVRKMLGLFDAEHGFRVVPEDVGRCRFEQFESFKGPLATAMYARQSKALETGFQAMNRMLKRESEKRARDRA